MRGRAELCGVDTEALRYTALREDLGILPLHEAAKTGQICTVKILSQDRENLDIPDNRGLTPLHYAALFRQSEVYEILVTNGANPRIEDNLGRTAESIMNDEYWDTLVSNSSCSCCII
jgi:ankyrin repeat protein